MVSEGCYVLMITFDGCKDSSIFYHVQTFVKKSLIIIEFCVFMHVVLTKKTIGNVPNGPLYAFFLTDVNASVRCY